MQDALGAQAALLASVRGIQKKVKSLAVSVVVESGEGVSVCCPSVGGLNPVPNMIMAKSSLTEKEQRHQSREPLSVEV